MKAESSLKTSTVTRSLTAVGHGSGAMCRVSVSGAMLLCHGTYPSTRFDKQLKVWKIGVIVGKMVGHELDG